MLVLEKLFGSGFELERTEKSAYSELSFVRHNGLRKVVKQIKLVSNGNEPGHGDALVANELVEYFYRQLKDRDVIVPKTYETRVIDGCAYHIVSNEGDDLVKQLELKPDLIVDRIERILYGISGILTQKSWTVGLDPRLSNFAGDWPTYIDLFPPLCKYGNDLYVHFPNPPQHKIAEEVSRKFSAVGILRRLRFELLVVDPSTGDIFEKLCRAELPRSLRKDISILEQMPDNLISTSTAGQLRKIVDRFTSDQVEEMRSFAARLVSLTGEDRKAVMKDVFMLTSSYNTKGYPATQAERLEVFKKMLFGYIP